MAWEKTGTANYTNGSPIVTGVGTSWFGALQSGHIFIGGDFSLYELLTVDSANQVTLGQDYRGPTATNQFYAVVPTMAMAHELVSKVQALLSGFQEVKDGPGQGKFITDLVKADDLDTGFGWPGSNEAGIKAGGDWQLRLKDGVASGAAVVSGYQDSAIGRLLITRAFGLGEPGSPPTISDFTNPPPAGFYRYLGGGTGAIGSPDDGSWWGSCVVGKGLSGDTFYIAARAQDANNPPKAWLGSCQEDGTGLEWTEVATDSSIRRGSNANGEYVQLPDGTQICTAAATSSASGGVTWTYPAAFVVTPKVLPAVLSSVARMLSLSARSVSSVDVHVFNENGVRQANSVELCAIGRWR